MMSDDPIRAAFEAEAYIEHHKGGDNLIWTPLKSSPRCTPLYTSAAIDAARTAALEEAAKACDAEASIEGIAQRCAARIRALEAK